MNTTHAHILLYSKSWYKERNVLDDLKQIIAHTYGYDAAQITDRWVWEIMVDVALTYLKPVYLREFVTLLFQNGSCLNYFQTQANFIPNLEKLCGLLGITRVVDENSNATLSLGDPDPAILPLSESAKTLLTEKQTSVSS